jgi:hypothetical protein
MKAVRHCLRFLRLGWRVIAVARVPFLALLISACGGGGGGSSNTPPPFSIQLVNNTVAWSYLEGTTPAAQVVTANATGNYAGTLYVAALVENGPSSVAIDPNILIAINGRQSTATIFPAAGLASGTYAGHIAFLVCSDPACATTIGGTPLIVSFTVTVLPGVHATPAALSIAQVSGQSARQDFTVQPGTGESAFTVGQPAPFVQVSNLSATGFSVTLPSLPVGSYQSAIPLTGSLGSQSSIPVSYTVTAPIGGEHGLSVNPGTLTMTAIRGAQSAPQSIMVDEPSWLPGLQAPTFSYAQGQDWLRVTPIAGGYSVVADATNLASGTYGAYITISANPLPNGISTFQTMFAQPFVSLTVGPGLVRPADVTTIFDAETTAVGLSGAVPINVAGGPPVTWNAASDVAWLTVSGSGVSGGNLVYGIDPAWLATVPNYSDQVANVTVSEVGSNLAPVTFAVHALPQLAEISGAGAHIQQAGKAATVVVSGRGFAALANPAARLTISGATFSSVQRINDHKLLVQLDAPTAGTHTVRLSNALGVTMPTRDLIAVSISAQTYAAVPSGGRIDELLVDHELGVVYGTNRSAGALERFTPGAGGWNADALAVPGLKTISLLQDGSPVLSVFPGTVRILDRATLADQRSVDLTCTGLDNLSDGGLPVTLDGRLWLATSTFSICGQATPYTYGTVGSLDPVTLQFQLEPIPNDRLFMPYFFDGPDFVMSRNGERLVMPQWPVGTYADFVYLDASDSVLRSTLLGVLQGVNFARGTISDDGNRLLVNIDRLLDGNFATIGRVVIPDYSAPASPAFAAAAVMSPDGNRAYILTYRSNDLNQPSTPYLPRVFVIDTSTSVGDTALPVLGFFELADYPSCISDATVCDISPPAAISLDGNTLYFGGSSLLVVAPVPAVLTPAAAAFRGAKAARTISATPWHLPPAP